MPTIRHKRRRFVPRKTPKRKCFFTTNRISYIDYKEIELLRHFINADGSIKRRSVTGTSNKHQRFLTNAIKRAREIGLLPFVVKE